MLFALDPTVKGAITFLRRLRVKVTASTVNETLQNHPDWTSMLKLQAINNISFTTKLKNL